jgi:hypothetical protein
MQNKRWVKFNVNTWKIRKTDVNSTASPPNLERMRTTRNRHLEHHHLLGASSGGAIGVGPSGFTINSVVAGTLVVSATRTVSIAAVRAVRNGHGQHGHQANQ